MWSFVKQNIYSFNLKCFCVHFRDKTLIYSVRMMSGEAWETGYEALCAKLVKGPKQTKFYFFTL